METNKNLPAESFVKEVRRNARRVFPFDEKILITKEAIQGKQPLPDLVVSNSLCK